MDFCLLTRNIQISISCCKGWPLSFCLKLKGWLIWVKLFKLFCLENWDSEYSSLFLVSIILLFFKLHARFSSRCLTIEQNTKVNTMIKLAMFLQVSLNNTCILEQVCKVYRLFVLGINKMLLLGFVFSQVLRIMFIITFERIVSPYHQL